MQKNSKTYQGDLRLTLDDDSVKRVSVYKEGRSVLLSDGGHPLSDIIVHPSNQETVEGWVREFELCRNVKVKKSFLVLPHLIKDFDDF